MYRGSTVFGFLVLYKVKFGTFDQINFDSGHYWERKCQLISPTNYPEKESEQKQR